MENLKKPIGAGELKRPTNTEELANNVGMIFTQFLGEELGNRVSQFGIKGLMDIIITEIKNYRPATNYKSVKEEVKNDVKK